MSASTATHFVRQTSDARCARDLLPPDMIELALHRLWLLCLATAGLASLSFAASFVVPLMIDGVLRPFHLLGDSPDLIMLLVSLVIARLVRRRTFAPRATILVGLAHEVVVAVWLCVTECVPLVQHGFQPVAYFSFTMAWARRSGPSSRSLLRWTSSCWPAWPKTPSSGLSVPESSHGGWPRQCRTTAGPRTGLGTGGPCMGWVPRRTLGEGNRRGVQGGRLSRFATCRGAARCRAR